MTVLCGAIRWRGDLRFDLTGMQEILAPYGTAETWSDDVGRCAVAVGVHTQEPSATRSSAVAVGAGGTLVAFADAHLHRRHELRSELRAPAAATDAQLALAAYERWGDSFVDHLSGAFVLVIVDRRRGGVLLVRDHAGDRYLAVHERDGVLAFATTALALTAFTGVGHELDLDRAAEVALLAYGTDRTFVRHVRSMHPGTATWIDGAGTRSWRWWLPREPPIRDAGSVDAHGGELREVLESSVRSVLDGAQKVGALVSGGLDSTSVAAVASDQIAPAPLSSFTSVPPDDWTGETARGWIPSEKFAVEALASMHPNMRPHFVDVPFGRLFGHQLALWELGAGPVRNPLNMIWVNACYDLAAAEGVDVMLTGATGNLAFSADGPRWLVELARRGRLIRMTREASQFATLMNHSTLRVLRGHLWALSFPRLQRWRAARRGNHPLEEWVAATAIRPERLESLDLMSILPDLTDPHPGGWTRDTDRMFSEYAAQADGEAATKLLWGIETRDPTADRRLVELAVTQPEWWRRHGKTGRAIVRAAMRDVLPPEIVERHTLGAQQPEWLDRLTAARAEVVEEVEAMREHPATCEVLDVPRLGRLLDTWPDRTRMADPQVINDYQLALPRAITLSRYLRWFEDRGRRVRSGGPAVLVSKPG